MSSWAARRLHSSVPGHWYTEITLLETLRDRSRSQHRSQAFLSRLDRVIRIGRLIAVEFEVDTAVLIVTDRVQKLMSEMQQALITATTLSSQMIQLRHFLPLQTTLVALYSRLYALTLVALDSVQPPVATSNKSSGTPIMQLAGPDIGEILYRPSRIDESASNSTLPQSSHDSAISRSTDIRKRMERKKRKQDAMDDIFGL